MRRRRFSGAQGKGMHTRTRSRSVAAGVIGTEKTERAKAVALYPPLLLHPNHSVLTKRTHWGGSNSTNTVRDGGGSGGSDGDGGGGSTGAREGGWQRRMPVGPSPRYESGNPRILAPSRRDSPARSRDVLRNRVSPARCGAAARRPRFHPVLRDCEPSGTPPLSPKMPG